MASSRRRPSFYKRHVGSYKIWLYGFNSVLIVVLFAFVSITCKILHKDRMYLFPLDHSEPLVLYVFCGSALQLLDIVLGLLGVWRRRTVLLTCYWWFLLSILVCDLIIGIMWIFRWRSLHSNAGEYFLNNLLTQYNETDFCRRWNSVQRELQCCGVYTSDDWRKMDNFCHEYLYNGTRLPESCCAHSTTSCSLGTSNQQRPSKGCRDKLIKWLYHQSNIIFLLGICVVVFLKVVGLVIMKTEIRQLGDEIFARKNRDAILAQPKFSVDLSPFHTVSDHTNTPDGSFANTGAADRGVDTVRLVITDCHGVEKEET